MPREINDRLEILSNTPSWFVRSGSFLLLIIVSTIILGACLIRYPDTITAKVTITTSNLPTAVNARQSGYLNYLMVRDGDEVKSGQLIGIIASSSKSKAVFKAQEMIIKAKASLNNGEASPLTFIDSLGSISNSISNLISSNNDYLRTLEDPLFEIRKRKLDSDKIRILEVIERTKNQIKSANNTIDLSQSQLERDSTLFYQNVISQRDYETTQKNYISDLQRLKDLLSELKINKAELFNIAIQREELITTREENLKMLKLEILKTIDLALNEINSWDQKFVLRAPIDGTISFFKLLDQNQFINSGDELMIIIPKKDELFGVCEAPSTGYGKIAIGQSVHIRLDNFPYLEYGDISGKVIAISKVARDGNYMVKVQLPNQLLTNYGNNLDFTQEMSGTALIITKDLRLIERIFGQFKLWYQRN